MPVTAAGVETAPFLEASEGLVKIFNLFGNPAFSVVQNDITGNINVSAQRPVSCWQSVVVNRQREDPDDPHIAPVTPGAVL